MRPMRILYCGDIVGRSGRAAVKKWVPLLRGEFAIDCVIASSDNAAGGFGTSRSVTKELLAAGVDVLTGGDHIWDQADAAQALEEEPRLLRPHNFPENAPGAGARVFDTPSGGRILVLHLLGQIFHKEYLDSPFACAERVLESYKLGQTVDAIFVDMHAEATSEKNAMGVFLDGRVSAVVGSHTHVPTADCRILRAGTAYQTDAGMCGDYDQTIIGFQPEGPLSHFIKKFRKVKMEPGMGEGTLSAVLIESNPKTGLARSITPLQRGGKA